MAGARELRRLGVIQPGQTVAAVLTGHVLKDPAVLAEIHRTDDSIAPAGANPPRRAAATIAAVARALGSLLR